MDDKDNVIRDLTSKVYQLEYELAWYKLDHENRLSAVGNQGAIKNGEGENPEDPIEPILTEDKKHTVSDNADPPNNRQKLEIAQDVPNRSQDLQNTEDGDRVLEPVQSSSMDKVTKPAIVDEGSLASTSQDGNLSSHVELNVIPSSPSKSAVIPDNESVMLSTTTLIGLSRWHSFGWDKVTVYRPQPMNGEAVIPLESVENAESSGNNDIPVVKKSPSETSSDLGASSEVMVKSELNECEALVHTKKVFVKSLSDVEFPTLTLAVQNNYPKRFATRSPQVAARSTSPKSNSLDYCTFARTTRGKPRTVSRTIPFATHHSSNDKKSKMNAFAERDDVKRNEKKAATAPLRSPDEDRLRKTPSSSIFVPQARKTGTISDKLSPRPKIAEEPKSRKLTSKNSKTQKPTGQCPAKSPKSQKEGDSDDTSEKQQKALSSASSSTNIGSIVQNKQPKTEDKDDTDHKGTHHVVSLEDEELSKSKTPTEDYKDVNHNCEVSTVPVLNKSTTEPARKSSDKASASVQSMGSSGNNLPSTSSLPSSSKSSKKRNKKKKNKSIEKEDDEAVFENARAEREKEMESLGLETSKMCDDFQEYHRQMKELRVNLLGFYRELPGMHPCQIEILELLQQGLLNKQILDCATKIHFERSGGFGDDSNLVNYKLSKLFACCLDHHLDDDLVIGDIYYLSDPQISAKARLMRRKKYLEMLATLSDWMPRNRPDEVLTLEDAKNNPVKLTESEYVSFVKHIRDQTLLRRHCYVESGEEEQRARERMTEEEELVLEQYEIKKASSDWLWSASQTSQFLQHCHALMNELEYIPEDRIKFANYYAYLLNVNSAVIHFDALCFAESLKKIKSRVVPSCLRSHKAFFNLIFNYSDPNDLPFLSF